MKHIKLFENFINEELSPELKKRTYDAMIKIAKDENNIDSVKRSEQAEGIMKSLSPKVEQLRKELENHAGKLFPNVRSVVKISDFGLLKDGYVTLYVSVSGVCIIDIVICKDKYEKGSSSASLLVPSNKLYKDRAFVGTLKKIIVQIQNDEIPGDETVPTEPVSLTPEGSLDNAPKEDVISRYGTGGDRGNFSGLPSQDTEAGQMARGM